MPKEFQITEDEIQTNILNEIWGYSLRRDHMFEKKNECAANQIEKLADYTLLIH